MTVYPTSVVPQVIDALVAQAPAYLPTGTKVYDGFGISLDTTIGALMVGVDDVDSQTGARGAQVNQDWANVGNLRRDETGYINCGAVSWDGDANMKVARDAAYAIAAGVEQLCRNNTTLGISNVLWTSFGGRVTFTQDQAEQGSIAVVTFQVGFRARL